MVDTDGNGLFTSRIASGDDLWISFVAVYLRVVLGR